MKKYFNFLFRQGVHSIRRSLLILVGMSISISVISGIGSYVNAVQDQYVENQLYFIGDMTVFSRDIDYRYTGHQYFHLIESSDELVQQRD